MDRLEWWSKLYFKKFQLFHVVLSKHSMRMNWLVISLNKVSNNKHNTKVRNNMDFFIFYKWEHCWQFSWSKFCTVWISKTEKRQATIVKIKMDQEQNFLTDWHREKTMSLILLINNFNWSGKHFFFSQEERVINRSDLGVHSDRWSWAIVL